MVFNPIALRMAKTPQSFGLSECSRDNMNEWHALILGNYGSKPSLLAAFVSRTFNQIRLVLATGENEKLAFNTFYQYNNILIVP